MVERLLAALALSAALAAALPAGLAAQGPLLTLGGRHVTVRYTPGALDRADHVQRRYTLLARDFGPKNAAGPVLLVELMSAPEWRAAGLPEPFGLPAIGASGSLVLPAWGNAESVATWRLLLAGRLPRIDGTPLRGSAEEAASLAAADLLGELEASRLLLAVQRLSGDRPWVDDLLAAALAASAFQRYEAPRWPEIRALFDRLARAGDPRLAERLRCAAYLEAAARIGEEAGKLPARPLLKMAAKKKGPLAAQRLLEAYPWLAEWSVSHGPS